MKALVIGCGRVGSAVSLQLSASGWDVTVLDENEDSLARLGDNWTGGFVIGHGMDMKVLRQAGIEDSDAVVVTTDGDNTNIVIAQAAQKHFGVPTVVARLLDPARAQFYAERGLRIVCPTSAAIETLVEAVRATEVVTT
ncbi:MAG TPA: TrkA family potassium uptake protein [Gaiellaceae bacterium]|nr:TrkA family potassium uptake protein [Gaiellaceae bacterium]